MELFLRAATVAAGTYRDAGAGEASAGVLLMCDRCSQTNRAVFSSYRTVPL